MGEAAQYDITNKLTYWYLLGTWTIYYAFKRDHLRCSSARPAPPPPRVLVLTSGLWPPLHSSLLLAVMKEGGKTMALCLLEHSTINYDSLQSYFLPGHLVYRTLNLYLISSQGRSSTVLYSSTVPRRSAWQLLLSFLISPPPSRHCSSRLVLEHRVNLLLTCCAKQLDHDLI